MAQVQEDRLRRLDDLLTQVRLAVQRPGYRRKVLRGLDAAPPIATLRLLRAVEVLSGSGAPSIRDVATRLAVEHSTASRSVEAAVRSRLLEKRACERDLRRVRLELTPRGLLLLEQASTGRRDLLGRVTAGWSPEHLTRLADLLDALCQGYDAVEREET